MLSSVSEPPLSVLVVDDSATYRMILSRAVRDLGNVNLVGQAPDGEAALRLIEELHPALVLLDISMPGLDGIETLKRIRSKWHDVDVVMCSGVDQSQTGLTMNALSQGALDFIPKPVGDNPKESFATLHGHLVPLIELVQHRRRIREDRKVFAPPPPKEAPASLPRTSFRSNLGAHSVAEPTQRVALAPSPTASEQRQQGLPSEAIVKPAIPPLVRRPMVTAPPDPRPTPVASARGGIPKPVSGRHLPVKIDLLVIGVSTGGPNALHALVPRLPSHLPVPILCVQHMPPIFTASLADRLNRESVISVEEAKEGVRPEKGNMYIAPGGVHMLVKRAADGQFRLHMTETPPVNSCRPSVDVLFRSAVEAVGGNILSLVLTGMGNDGADGVHQIRAKGGWSLIQDEATSVVWGMPGAVAHAGDADEILPLDKIADRIVEIFAPGGRS